MVFVGENRRAGRSTPVINSTFLAIIISKHRAKTPRTKKEKKEKKKNWEQLLPITPFPPLTLMNLFLLRGSADFFNWKNSKENRTFLSIKNTVIYGFCDAKSGPAGTGIGGAPFMSLRTN